MPLPVPVITRSADETDRIADRVTAAFTDGDETFQRLVFSAGFVMWHNTDQEPRQLEEALELIARVRSRCAKIEHANIRRTPVPGGYVQESLIRFTTYEGAVYASPACILVTLDSEDRVAAAREYTDSAGLPPMFYEA